jgi:6-pyruvoyltetrahydropterin/6-carboxytetrahydropterin synthase
MFYITKTFKVPMGHRLSELVGSKCLKIHGHNFNIEITVKSNVLNKNNMVMDFSKLKDLVNDKIDSWDHGMFLNKNDQCVNSDLCSLHYTDGDPTAEYLCKYLYYEIIDILPEPIVMHSVSIWETDSSKATYKEGDI